MRISDWSSDVCSSDLNDIAHVRPPSGKRRRQGEPFRLIVGDGNVEVRGLGLGKHRRGLKRAEARAGVPEEEAGLDIARDKDVSRSEEHTSELQSLMRISYAVFCLTTKSNPSPSCQTQMPYPPRTKQTI